MKIIDFEKCGNVIRFYLGADDCTDYWGDDFNDAPYEHNAGTVYDEFVKHIVEYAFNLDLFVTEPSDDWYYNGNSPYSKENFIDREAPCLLVIKNNDDWDISYHKYLGADSNDVLKIFFNDDINDIESKIFAFGGVKVADKMPFR